MCQGGYSSRFQFGHRDAATFAGLTWDGHFNVLKSPALPEGFPAVQ
jgi:hypothetical protein